jgi:hypothetical protein
MHHRARPTKPNDSFEPGSYGFHEMVDRSCLIADLFSREIGEHPAAKHAKLRKRVTRIEEQLFELYQVAATMHE